MTKINKMVMHGFKSFAKHTEMPFGDSYNCILGPNGSGKCLTGDTIVQLADGSTVPIKQVFDSAKKNPFKEVIDDGIIYYGGNQEIICLDTDTLKTKSKKILAYVKRTSPKKLAKITTKSGKKITTTLYHPLFTLKNNEFVSIKAEDIKKGVKIAVPRQIHIKKNSDYFYELIDLIKPKDNIYVPYNPEFTKILKKIKGYFTWKQLSRKLSIPKGAIKGLLDKQSINFSFLIKILRYSGLNDKNITKAIQHIKSKTGKKTYKIPWKNTSAFSKILGYLYAEGRLTGSSGQIWFTNSDEELIDDYKNLWKKEFNIDVSINEYKPMCWDAIVYSKPLITLLSKFGLSDKSTEHKKIENFYLSHSSDKELSELLNGLYCGDGYVSNSTIELVTKSKKLASGVESILLRLGIHFNSKFIVKVATNSGYLGIYKSIVISGADNITKYSKKIKLTHQKKQERIKKILSKKINPNLDLIEVNQLVKKTAQELNINIKKTKKKFPRLDSYCYNQCTPSVFGVKKLINDLFIPIDTGNCLSLQKLKKLVDSDIYWDEVTNIEYIDSDEKWVYDLCVEKDHNFVANNMFVHNSNVLDALCFVLGKSSSKSLRAEKSANLIYNGGKSKKPAKSGEVSIYFNNENKVFPTDSKEVKISRIVKHSGQSVYKINDKTRTRQEIVDLLNIGKINPDGYNIILQGDIVKFVEMHPIERRQLIESISGISVYEEKKKKAMNELERVDDRLKETEIVLTERNTYLKELKKDRDTALKYKDMNDRIKQNKASFLKIQIDNKENDHKKLQEKINKSNELLEKLNKKIEELRAINKEKKQEIEKLNKEIEEKGETEQVNLNREVESLKIEITKVNGRIDTCSTEIQKINQRKEDLNNSLKDTDEKISHLNNEKTELNKKIDEKKQERNEFSEKLSKFKEKNKLEDLGDIEKDVEEIDKKSEQLQKEINEIREKQHNLIREKDKISHEVNTIDAKIRKVLNVEKEHKKELDQLKNKREEFKKSVHELNSCLDKDADFSIKISSAKKELTNSNEELEKLRARDIGRKEMTYSNIAVKKILEQKNSISGIHGTVADLGKVDSKFSLALEIAAGPRINSIVVENDKVASDCIKYLKQNKLGVATFLPINKIKPRAESPKIKKLSDARGSHGKALDLITFDNKFKNIFSYVFGDTIIIDNIDVARRLGVGTAKFVTLDGDMSEVSGVMHGGFRNKRKGLGFKEKDLTEDINKINAKISTLQVTIQNLQKQREDNENLIQTLREKKATLEGEIIKTEKSLHLEPSEVDMSEKQKQELKVAEKNIDKEIEEIAKKVSTSNRDLAELKIKKQKLRSEISELRNPRLLAELNTYEEKIREFNEEIIKEQSDIKNIDTQIKNIYEPDKEKTSQILKQLDKEEEKFNEEKNTLKKEIKDKNELLKQKEEAAKEFYLKFKGLFAKRNELDKLISGNDNKINQKLNESREIEFKNNNLSLKNAGLSAELSGLKQDFSQYEGVKLDTSKPEEELKKEINKFERMRENIGSVNMRALDIYEEVETQYKNLLEKKDKLTVEKEDVISMMEEIEGKKKSLFMETLEVVNKNFQDFFGALSTKGEAELVLEDPENPFEAGLRVNVKITGSKFMDIRSLSGGEKTLTALAFIFAIQEHDPASFYILDEVDAALDKHNSEKLAKLVRKYSDRAQYIIISHNDSVISEADNLYGVSMNEHGMSKVVSLKI